MLCCVLAFSQHATLFAQAFGIARDTPQRWNVLKSGHQNRPTTFLPASTKASFRQIQRRSFFRLHSSRNGGSSKSRNEDDIPLDWNDEEMLAEFGDLSDADADTSIDDDEEEPRDTEDEMVEFDDEELVDDDDIFLDEISLDDEDDEDDEDDDDEDDEQVGRSIDSGECYHSDEYGEADWDEEVDGGEYELEDDPDDPNYMKQKEIVESAIASSQQRSRDEAFDPFDFVMNEMTEDQASILDKFPFMKEVEERARGMMLSESDVEKIDLDKALEEVPDLARDDPYPRHDPGESNILEALTGVTDDDMEEFDKTYKKIRDKLDEEPWDKVMLKEITGWQHVPNETLDEMSDCLVYLSGSSYNVTRWLLYDLDFNVSNLMLAAIKHNPDAPILFNHWYPQLVTYSRYEHCRERGFDFTWRDVENSDLQELQRYYAGFGYPEIPSKAPSETGIISLEDLDEDEIKMAAFEEWMAEVYNAEGDRKDFDDDDMQDYDNVFSDYYEPPQHPDKPPFGDVVDDIASWREEMGDDPSVVEYRDYMGESFSYDVVHDEEFQREFRGHLVIACTSDDSDLEIAEKITARFQSAFGKQVWVETRVIALAREEDNVFEIWLESYEIDLLHSKKRANSSNQDWKGPAECDDKQIDYLVDRVKFLISDDARYSYRLEYETIN
ncbi:hypothetical protein ACA910_018152 [Epithemia clementina (nom. ined.)]